MQSLLPKDTFLRSYLKTGKWTLMRPKTSIHKTFFCEECIPFFLFNICPERGLNSVWRLVGVHVWPTYFDIECPPGGCSKNEQTLFMQTWLVKAHPFSVVSIFIVWWSFTCRPQFWNDLTSLRGLTDWFERYLVAIQTFFWHGTHGYSFKVPFFITYLHTFKLYVFKPFMYATMKSSIIR